VRAQVGQEVQTRGRGRKRWWWWRRLYRRSWNNRMYKVAKKLYKLFLGKFENE